MHKLDMSGVSPLRLAEIRSRVEIIQAFLKIPRPTPEQRDQHAQLVGLKTKSFMRLVAIWKRQRKPYELDGAGRAKASAPRSRMPAETRKAITDAATELGPMATLAEIMARATELCTERGTTTVGRSAVWNVLMDSRRDGKGPGIAKSAIILAEVFARLPVQYGDTLVLPRVGVALLAPEGAIVAHRVSIDPDGKPEDEQLLAIARARLRNDGPGREIFSTTSTDPGERKATAHARKLLSRTLGRGIGTLDVRYRHGPRRGDAALPKSRINRPVSPADAREVIRLAVAGHNASRCPQGIPSYDFAPSSDGSCHLDGKPWS